MRFITCDDIKATLAAIGGFSVQLADVDMIFKLSIGALTITYLLIKIVHLLKGQKDNE